MFVSRFLLSCAALFVAVNAAASPALSPLVRHRSRRDVPQGWSLHRRADPHARVPLKFALTQANLDKLDDYLLDIADPQSPNYGKHWSPAKVIETFRPSEDSVDTVHAWLVNDAGIHPQRIRLTPDGSSLHLDVSIAEAENILATEYYVYRHSEDGSEHVGCHRGYHLPQHVTEHVDLVWPTVNFDGGRIERRGTKGKGSKNRGIHRPSGTKEAAGAQAIAPGATNCDTGATLDCLRELYNFHYTPVSADKNSIAVLEFGENVFLQSDLNTFFRKFDPPQVGHQPQLVSIGGGHLNNNEKDFDDLAEATMDFQLVMGLLGAKQDVLLYQVGENNTQSGSLLTDELLGALDGSYCNLKDKDLQSENLKDCGNKPRANVVSISYSTDVDIIEFAPELQRQCAEYGKLSLTGMTFVASSGDNGVAFSAEDGCRQDDGTFVGGDDSGDFLPQFPASCPFVTAVGSTEVAPGKSVRDPERATTDFPSGGGFSNAFPRPSYQNRVVSRYLKKWVSPQIADLFNNTGRAYPDVSANGHKTVTVVNGAIETVGGTSASAPIFASLIAAVNDARIAAGKAPVGFINPALYSHSFRTAFNDIYTGSNPGCGTKGFPAARGWDPVTGLGTPNFPRLLSRFMALP